MDGVTADRHFRSSAHGAHQRNAPPLRWSGSFVVRDSKLQSIMRIADYSIGKVRRLRQIWRRRTLLPLTLDLDVETVLRAWQQARTHCK